MSPTRWVDITTISRPRLSVPDFGPNPDFLLQILAQTQAFCSRFWPKPRLSAPDFGPSPGFLFQILAQTQASSCLQALEENSPKLQVKIQSSGLLEVQVHCIVQRSSSQAGPEYCLYTVREAGNNATLSLVPRLSLHTFHTASDGKLGGAWENEARSH